jgi:hypothetical protein
MNDNKRQAIVWDTIERLAFRPSSDSDRGAWLGVYARTLHTLWGIEPMWDHFVPNDIINIPFLDMECHFNIENLEKYSVSLIQESSPDLCYWQSHIDPEYLSKGSLYSTNGRYPRQQRARLQRDIKAVLDGMIFHPRCHVHLQNLVYELDPNSGGLSSHEIRIGGGIENAYVFLFHLRFQFCLVSNQTRDNEKVRLIDLFENAIWNKLTVSARDLFNFRSENN